jgi:hypothetical protein
MKSYMIPVPEDYERPLFAPEEVYKKVGEIPEEFQGEAD